MIIAVIIIIVTINGLSIRLVLLLFRDRSGDDAWSVLRYSGLSAGPIHILGTSTVRIFMILSAIWFFGRRSTWEQAISVRTCYGESSRIVAA